MLKLGPEYNEKRLFSRMKIDAPVDYTIPGDSTLYRGHCMNLSHSGIQFNTANMLSEGKSIEVIMDTKSDKFKPMKATVKILRVEPDDSGDRQYKVAGRILEFK